MSDHLVYEDVRSGIYDCLHGYGGAGAAKVAAQASPLQLACTFSGKHFSVRLMFNQLL